MPGSYNRQLPLKIDEKEYIQHNADCGGNRSGKTDLCQAGVWLDTHKVSQRQSDKQCLGQSLDHNPERLVITVEIADHAEQNSGQDCFRRKSFQVSKAVLDNLCVGRENTGQQVTLPQNECKYTAAECKTDSDTGQHCLTGTLWITCAYILCDKGSHGLHQGTWDQHGKVDDLAGNAIPGGGSQSQTVDKGTECQKGNLGQAFLQCQWQTDAQELAALCI